MAHTDAMFADEQSCFLRHAAAGGNPKHTEAQIVDFIKLSDGMLQVERCCASRPADGFRLWAESLVALGGVRGQNGVPPTAAWICCNPGLVQTGVFYQELLDACASWVRPPGPGSDNTWIAHMEGRQFLRSGKAWLQAQLRPAAAANRGRGVEAIRRWRAAIDDAGPAADTDEALVVVVSAIDGVMPMRSTAKGFEKARGYASQMFARYMWQHACRVGTVCWRQLGQVAFETLHARQETGQTGAKGADGEQADLQTGLQLLGVHDAASLSRLVDALQEQGRLADGTQSAPHGVSWFTAFVAACEWRQLRNSHTLEQIKAGLPQLRPDFVAKQIAAMATWQPQRCHATHLWTHATRVTKRAALKDAEVGRYTQISQDTPRSLDI